MFGISLQSDVMQLTPSLGTDSEACSSQLSTATDLSRTTYPPPTHTGTPVQAPSEGGRVLDDTDAETTSTGVLHYIVNACSVSLYIALLITVTPTPKRRGRPRVERVGLFFSSSFFLRK